MRVHVVRPTFVNIALFMATALISGCVSAPRSATSATPPLIATHWGEANAELDTRVGERITVEGIAYDPQRDHQKSLAGITTEDGHFFMASLPDKSFHGEHVRVTGILYRDPPLTPASAPATSSDFSPRLVRAFPGGTFYGLVREERFWKTIEAR